MKKGKIISTILLGLLALTGCKTINNSTSSLVSSNTASSSSSSEKVSSTSSSSQSSSSYSSVISSSTNSPSVSTSTLTPVENPEQSLYLIGAAVWGWSNYAPLTLMTDNVFYGTFDIKTSTEGFVITNQTDFNGLVFKTSSNSNFTVTEYGEYQVRFTYDETKIDETWTQATEKNNAATGYYKIELLTSFNVTIDEEMMYVCGGALDGWGTYLPLFLDEETGVYSYTYGLSTSTEGFIVTNAEDNQHAVYHYEDGSNFKVAYAGDYQIMFTYNDMSNDSSWIRIYEQNDGAAGYLKIVAQFETPDDPIITPNEEEQLYLFGTAVGNWSTPISLPEVEEGLYQVEIIISNSAEGFVICELDTLSNKTGFCLHAEDGSNFTVDYTGLYRLSVTSLDMSSDSSWLTAIEVNSIEIDTMYYKLERLFELSDEDLIENIYLNGGNVGGWSTYVSLTKVNDSLFQGKVTLSESSDGFVITAQQSRGSSDIVFKTPDGVNLNISAAGNYTVSFSLEEQDSSWVEVTDCKGNYSKSCYIKLEQIIETRTNVALKSGVSASASSAINDVKTADKVFDNIIGDTNRWESEQGVDPQWLILDLGTAYSINAIDIQWYGGASAATYTIEYSLDGETWTVLEDVTNSDSTRNRLDSYQFAAISARYIKINGTSRVNTYGYSISELYVWEA